MASGGVALVTGANKGLGKETARQLAQRGMTVLLDVTDAGRVEAVAEAVRRDHGRLDVLVNNAGTIVEAAAIAMTATQLRQTFEVNVSSTTASLTLTGGGTDFGGNFDRRLAYAASKAALNMVTVQYANAFAKDAALSHLKINAATPGYTATDMDDNSGTRSVAEGARIVVDLATLPEDGPSGGFFNDQGPVPW